MATLQRKKFIGLIIPVYSPSFQRSKSRNPNSWCHQVHSQGQRKQSQNTGCSTNLQHSHAVQGPASDFLPQLPHRPTQPRQILRDTLPGCVGCVKSTTQTNRGKLGDHNSATVASISSSILRHAYPFESNF